MGDPLTSLGIGVGVSAASRLLNPGQRTVNRVRNEANRIEDLGAPDANYGYPIRELLGVCRVNGCSMIWARPLREEITTSTETQVTRQGKGLGGSRQTTITETETATYYFTAAFLIGGRINRLERVWANGVQIYSQGESNDIVNAFGGYTELYFGDQTAPSPTIIFHEGEAPTFNGYSYIVFDEYPIELYKGSGFPRIDIEVYGKYTETSPERLNFYNSITHITNLAGIPESSIDLTGTGPGVVMYGATFENNGETYASYLDDLALVHSLDYREENGKLRIYTRFGTPGSAIQIKRGALSARQYGEEVGDLYLRKRTDPISLPSEVRIDFFSRQKELNRNNVFYQDASAEHSKSDRITTRIVTNEADMTSLAARLLYQAKTESHTIEDLYLMPSYAGIRVGDFIGIQERDINRMYRVTEVTIGEDYRVKVSAVGSRGMFSYVESDIDSPPAYTPIALPDIVPTPVVETNYRTTSTNIVGTASVIPLDINLIRDQDASGTLYVAVVGDANWIGGGIYLSRDGGASYGTAATASQSSITGTVSTITPAGQGLDLTTVIRVTGVTAPISSVTQIKFDLGDGLLCLIGNEIIMARDAVLVSPGVYDLSYLQRGYRGTESANASHGVNERFVVLSGPIARVLLRADDIGRTLRLKAVGLYGSEPSVNNWVEFVYSGASFAPRITDFSPRTGAIGDPITIYGSRFTGSSSAAINGVAIDNVVVIDDETITGTVPAGATTGKISVSTVTATVYSAAEFVVDAILWGEITGTLSNQTDLQNALNSKYNNPTGSSSQYIRGDGSIADFQAPSATEIIAGEFEFVDTLASGGLPVVNLIKTYRIVSLYIDPRDGYGEVTLRDYNGQDLPGFHRIYVDALNPQLVTAPPDVFVIGGIQMVFSSVGGNNTIIDYTLTLETPEVGSTVNNISTISWLNITGRPTFSSIATTGAFADIQGNARDNPSLLSEFTTIETNINNKMSLSTYDSDSDGVVDVAASVEGSATAGFNKYYGTDSGGTVGFYDLPTTSWGGITGTLSSQTDLQNALNNKMSIATYDSTANGVVDVAASVEGIGTAGNSKYYGTNESGTAGFYDLPVSGQKSQRIATLIGGITLSLSSDYFQFLNPTTTNCVVFLPAVTASDYFECEIVNNSTVNPLPIKEDGGILILTLENANDKARSVYCYWDGTIWQVWVRGYY